MRKNLDPESLLTTVGIIDFHERAAEDTFKKLLAFDAKAVNIMRAYAEFLVDIKDDAEQSDALLQLADEIEEIETKARRHVETKRRSLKGRATIVEVVKEEQEGSERSRPTAVVACVDSPDLPGQLRGFARESYAEDRSSVQRSNSTMSSGAGSLNAFDQRSRVAIYRSRILSTK